MSEDFDLIVVGGGPTGSTLATFVAMQGHKVLLLERDRFPRYQIGESLLPATINGICELLSVDEKIKQVGFPKKLGGTFRWGKEPDLWTLNFGYASDVGAELDSNPNRVYAYQVKRAQFDEILLKNAREKGVDVREEHCVHDLLIEGDRITGVYYLDKEGQEKTATSRFVADASGHQSRIYKRVGKRTYSRFYRNVAIYGYYYNGKRLPEPISGNVLFEAFDQGWLWYIPLSDTLTSVGAVIPTEHAQLLKRDHEFAMQNFIAACPIINEYLSEARRATEVPYDEIRIRREFSYCNTCFWKPGLILVGDSACFIDVLLSSGVHLATYSALLAARSINTSLIAKIDEESCFNEFEIRYRLEFSKFYQLLVGLYDMHKDSRTYHSWLRAWLRTTNAFSLEPLEQNVEDLITQKRKRQSNWFFKASYLDSFNFKTVDFLRKFNQETLEAVEEPPTMEQIQPLPYIEGELIPSSDRLHWLKV